MALSQLIEKQKLNYNIFLGLGSKRGPILNNIQAPFINFLSINIFTNNSNFAKTYLQYFCKILNAKIKPCMTYMLLLS